MTEPYMSPLEALEKLDPVGVAVECVVCGKHKNPWGRSAPMEMASGLCHNDCAGYRQAPQPGSLWPGERASEFGYPCVGVNAEAIAVLRSLVERHEKGVVMWELERGGTLTSFTTTETPGARSVRLVPDDRTYPEIK